MISNCRAVESQEDFDMILTIETSTVRNPIRFRAVFEALSSNDFRYRPKNFHTVCTRQRIPQTLDIFPRSWRRNPTINPTQFCDERVTEMETMTLISCILIILSLISTGKGERFSKFFPPEAQPAERLWRGKLGEVLTGLVNARKGNSVKGVTELKKYLQSFGYLSHGIHNFTDSYDERVESAVKLYQHSFGLPVTGNLDIQTLTQISTPRCGVADSIDGSSVTPKLKHFTFFHGTPRWPRRKRNLSYAFSPLDKSLGIDEFQLRTVLSRAFDRWSRVIPVTFTATEDFESADVKIGFFSGDHGDNQAFDGPLGTLGHAFCPQNGRLHLDAEEQWSLNLEEDKAAIDAIDLESICTHEIGHVLGLGHSSLKSTVMYPFIPPRTRKVDLTADDVSGAQALYGINPHYSGGLNQAFNGFSLFFAALSPLFSWGVFILFL